MRFFHDRCDCLGAQPRFMAYTELGGGAANFKPELV